MLRVDWGGCAFVEFGDGLSWDMGGVYRLEGSSELNRVMTPRGLCVCEYDVC